MTRYPYRYQLCLLLLALSLLESSPAAPPSLAASLASPEPSLELRAKWGTNGTAKGQFDAPGGVAANAAGNDYVADSYNHRVQ